MADKPNYARNELDFEQRLVASSDENTVFPDNASHERSRLTDEEAMIGRLINDKYRIVRCIGSGGMGTIYEAEDLALKRRVAIKLLLPSIAQDDRSLRRFQQEAKAASRLSHENIVKVFEFGLHNQSQPYLVMEYVRGTSLADIIQESHRLGIDRTAKLILQIVKGLEHAHQNRVIHRDLKTSNILVSQEDDKEVVKIVDFGIAKIAEEGIQSLTSTGEIFGSPFYMSPEQCSGEQLDGRSDIYSLGCVMFECLTGLPPHIGDSPLVTLMKHQQEPALSLKEATLGGAFPGDLEHIVAKMLAKLPSDRYSSATALEYELSNFIEGNKFQEAPQEEISSAADDFNRTGKLTSFRHFQQLNVPAYDALQKRKEPKISHVTVLFAVALLILMLGVTIVTDLLRHPTPHQLMRETTSSRPVSRVTESSLRAPKTSTKEEADKLLKDYANHPNLTQVVCAHLEPSPGQWQQLSSLKALKNLDLTGSIFSDDDLSWLSKLPIQALTLQACYITGTGLKHIENIKSLRYLDLTETPIDDEKMLAHLNPGLRELRLKGLHHFKGATLTELLRLPDLHRLLLENQAIGDKAVPALGKLKNLDYLDVRGTFLSPEGIARLRKELPNCVIEDTDLDVIKIQEKHNAFDDEPIRH